jgi:hypothetical protein
MSSATVSILSYPNDQGTPAKGTPFGSGPTGVTFEVPGLNANSPIVVLTNYTGTGVYELTSKPCNNSVTAVLSSTWQADGYEFVTPDGGNIGGQETLSGCPAQLYVRASNVITQPSSHGGGEIALLTFLVAAVSWQCLRRSRRMPVPRSK